MLLFNDVDIVIVCREKSLPNLGDSPRGLCIIGALNSISIRYRICRKFRVKFVANNEFIYFLILPVARLIKVNFNT